MSKIHKLGLGIVAFEGCEHLKNIISTIKDSVDYVVVSLQEKSYHGISIDPKDFEEAIMCYAAGLIDDIIWYYPDLSYLDRDFDPQEPRYLELEKRNQLLDYLESKGCSHAAILDGDEFFVKEEFDYAKNVIDNNDDIHITYCPYISYYKDYNHIIKRDWYPYQPLISEIKYRFKFAATFCYAADYTRRYDAEDTIPYVFMPNEILSHNLSWIRSKVENKVDSWSSKSHYNDADNIREKCINDHESYNGGQKATVYTRMPNFEAIIEELKEQIIFPKYDLDEKIY